MICTEEREGPVGGLTLNKIQNKKGRPSTEHDFEGSGVYSAIMKAYYS